MNMDLDVTASLDLLAERFRQIQEFGYTYEHDDRSNADGELVTAAIYYAADAPLRGVLEANGVTLSGLHGEVFDPKDKRTNLIRAAALLLAEVEREDRIARRQKC